MIATLSNLTFERPHASIAGQVHFIVLIASGSKRIELPANADSKWSTIVIDDSWPQENIDMTFHDKRMMVFVGDVVARSNLTLKNLESSRRHSIPVFLTDSMNTPAGNVTFILTKRKPTLDSKMSAASKDLEEKTRNVEKLQRKVSDRKLKEENDKKTAEEKSAEKDEEKKRLVLQIRRKQAALRVVKRMYARTTGRAFERWTAFIEASKEEEELKASGEPSSVFAPPEPTHEDCQIKLCYLLKQVLSNYLRLRISSRFSHWNRCVTSELKVDMLATVGAIKYQTMKSMFNLMMSKTYRNGFQHWVKVTQDESRSALMDKHDSDVSKLRSESRRSSLVALINKWIKAKKMFGFRAILHMADIGRGEEVADAARAVLEKRNAKMRSISLELMKKLIMGSNLKKSFKHWLHQQRVAKLISRWVNFIDTHRNYHKKRCFDSWKIGVLSSIAELGIDDKMIIYGPRSTIILLLTNGDEHKIQVAMYQSVQTLYDVASTLQAPSEAFDFILYHEGRILDRRMKFIDFCINDNDCIKQLPLESTEAVQEAEGIVAEENQIVENQEPEQPVFGRVNPLGLLKIVVVMQSICMARTRRAYLRWYVGSLLVALESVGQDIIKAGEEFESLH